MISTSRESYPILPLSRLFSGPPSQSPWTRAADGKEKWGSNTYPWWARECEPIMGPGAKPPAGSRGQSPRWGSGEAQPPCSRRGFCV